MPLYNVDFLTGGVITMTPQDASVTPPAPPSPAPAPTPPPAPVNSLVPRPSIPGSEVLNSSRNKYTANQPSLPLAMAGGVRGEYVTSAGRSTGAVFINVPFIIPEGFTNTVWFDWTAAPWDTPCPVWVSVSTQPDDWQGLSGAALTALDARGALANGNASWVPTKAGLYYLVFKRPTPGSGDKLVAIAS